LQIKVSKVNAGEQVRYASPDGKNGQVLVTFNSVGTGKDGALVVDKILFKGEKPSSNN